MRPRATRLFSSPAHLEHLGHSRTKQKTVIHSLKKFLSFKRQIVLERVVKKGRSVPPDGQDERANEESCLTNLGSIFHHFVAQPTAREQKKLPPPPIYWTCQLPAQRQSLSVAAFGADDTARARSRSSRPKRIGRAGSHHITLHPRLLRLSSVLCSFSLLSTVDISGGRAGVASHETCLNTISLRRH